MGLLRIFHSAATPSRRKRKLLTPRGLLIFGLPLAVIVLLGLYTDGSLGLREPLPGSLGNGIGTMPP